MRYAAIDRVQRRNTTICWYPRIYVRVRMALLLSYTNNKGSDYKFEFRNTGSAMVYACLLPNGKKRCCGFARCGSHVKIAAAAVGFHGCAISDPHRGKLTFDHVFPLGVYTLVQTDPNQVCARGIALSRRRVVGKNLERREEGRDANSRICVTTSYSKPKVAGERARWRCSRGRKNRWKRLVANVGP